ncbi:MAG: 2-oxoglutarate dehydrogenase E1 component [Planctomycetaceae bacterium]
MASSTNTEDHKSVPVPTTNGHAPDLDVQSLLFVEQLYEQYLAEPGSLPEDWRDYFSQMGRQENFQIGPHFTPRSIFNPPSTESSGLKPSRSKKMEVAGRQERLDQLIRNFRVRGHIMASLDPLGRKRAEPAELDPAFYGFTEEDYDSRFSTSWFGGPEVRTLREMVQWLRNTYCRSIGVQFMHIDSLSVREWLQDRMERTANHLRLSKEHQIRILTKLSDAIVFEEFIQKKFIGAKSFSLEGAETLIPLLDMAIERASDDGVREVVLGMAHRGRLNVLSNIMSKSPRAIFREFEDRDPELNMGRGDVKYHLGYSHDWVSRKGNEVHLTLCFNPSHLEFVNPVALGRLKAKQDRIGPGAKSATMCVLIHGDAAFAGEGIVQETLNLSELSGYRTGGTIHVVVNNQIGFTTSPEDSRSTTYATDVAKMLQIPIFHVNGEDPEAVAQVVSLAMDFRKKFKRDVVIDMYCYRRRGHNEGDEPSFTQPVLYRRINERPNVFEGYLEKLLQLREITRNEANYIVEQRRELLEEELNYARRDDYVHKTDTGNGIWAGYYGGLQPHHDEEQTGLPIQELSEILQRQTTFPDDFTPHPKILRLLEQRAKMAAGEIELDWGGAEALAYGSLVREGYRLRISGQDVERGTFSHRHAVLHDYNTGNRYMPLRNVAKFPGNVNIYNSALSEAGVLGFDYGYSLDCPDGLTIWEAQFGDFSNVAQVIFDQFICSAEEKWRRLSGLVVLLPHGFEGQGPEHSSARLERYLMLAAEDNMQIVVPSSPAQYFHMLRRQMIRKWRKPLIVMTPKSLLRHKEAVSTMEECANGHFSKVIPDLVEGIAPKNQVRRILLCSGKIYYDLLAQRRENNHQDVHIIRVEQLYPLPQRELKQALSEYPDNTPVYWVQEEPENMGAWRFMRIHYGEKLFERFPFAGLQRPASASPATGSKKSHDMEQTSLLEAAFQDFCKFWPAPE